MKKAVLIIFGLGLLFFTEICSAEPKGDLVVCQGAEINSLDPARHRALTDLNYSIQVFDMLYFRDEKANPVPRLALSHKVINDMTWEFALRRGVKFHNGAVLTAKDVKFSIDRMIDPQTKAFPYPWFSTIKEVKVVDDHTVQIVTKSPDPILLKRLGQDLIILPSDLFREKGGEAFFQHPVGTGPFKFVSWIINDRMVLEANEGYWDGAPKVKRLILRAVPEVSTRLAELLSGNADIISNIPPFLVSQVKESANATVQSILTGRVQFLCINCLADGPLKNKSVRQALNYAVDKKAIIENILKGSGVPRAVNLSPYQFGFDPSLTPYPYDPAKAKKLLAEAGYPNGIKLVLNTPSGRYLLDKEVSEAITGMFKAVGIEADLRIVEWGTYTQTLMSKKLQDLGFIGLADTTQDADINLTLYFTPESTYSYYSTPELAEKIKRARTTMDEKKRLEIYKEVQREIYEEAPLVFLYQQMDHYGISKKVKGFQARGDEQLVLNQASK